MSEDRFCVNCKHFVSHVLTGATSQCEHPNNTSKRHPVYGSVVYESPPAQMRSATGVCGPAGTMFEEKPKENAPSDLEAAREIYKVEAFSAGRYNAQAEVSYGERVKRILKLQGW